MSHDTPTPEQEHAAGLHNHRAVRWCRECAIAMQHKEANHWSKEAAEMLDTAFGNHAPSPEPKTIPEHILDRERMAGIRTMLRALGEDPDREGLKDTPKRVIKAWRELCRGYETKVADFMTTFSTEGHDHMILCGPIQFYSMCEHHLLPFFGQAWVAYVPQHKLVGLSKLPRLVEMYARRLQNQERMTNQIADTLMEAVGAKGTACLVNGQHLCMMARGVRQPTAVMTTTALRGVFMSQPEVRAEFLSNTSK